MQLTRFLKSKSFRYVAIPAACALTGLTLTVISRKSPEEVRFQPAPNFTLKDDQGRPHSLKDAKGKLVILHFWATWCAPCLEELPAFIEFTKQFEKEPVRFIAISLDRDWVTAHRYLKTEKVPPHVLSLIDPKSEVPDAFGSYQFPETYLISPDLKILSKWVGAQNWAGSEWPEILRPLLDAVKTLRSHKNGS